VTSDTEANERSLNPTGSGEARAAQRKRVLRMSFSDS